MLYMITSRPTAGNMNLSGSMTRQVYNIFRQDQSVKGE